MENASWQDIEKLIEEIHNELIPDADIERNAQIWGHDSECNREIDIAIRSKIGIYDLLIAIECKHHKRPIDIKSVGEFISTIRDIRANKGVMISTSGFTKKAKTLAQKACVEVYSLIDIDKHNWRNYMNLTVIVDIRSAKDFGIGITTSNMVTNRTNQPRDDVVFNEEKEQEGTVAEIAEKMRLNILDDWNKKKIPDVPGRLINKGVLKGKKYIRANNEFVEIQFTFYGRIEKKLYINNLKTGEIEGLVDEINDRTFVSRVTSEVIDLYKIEEEWQEIENQNDLAITPNVYIKLRKG